MANRVAQNQALTDCSSWHRVSTDHNHADIISEVAGPNDLLQSGLWWQGPHWLQFSRSMWPFSGPDCITGCDIAHYESAAISLVAVSTMEDTICKFSSCQSYFIC